LLVCAVAKRTAGEEYFCAREILRGYDSLFRDGPTNVFSPAKRPSGSIIVNSTMSFDLQMLTGGA